MYFNYGSLQLFFSWASQHTIVSIVSLLYTLEPVYLCAYLFLVNVFLLAELIRALKTCALKSTFSESAAWQKGKAGPMSKLSNASWQWTASFFLSCWGSWNEPVPAISLERPYSTQIPNRIWLAVSNALVFVPFFNFTPLFQLTMLPFTLLLFHFFKKRICALWTQFCHLPPDTLRSNRLADSPGNAI